MPGNLSTPKHALLTIRTVDEVPENALLIAACVKGEWVELWRIVGFTVAPHAEV